ncbi:MAG TPA: biotin/lipoyl-containing protein [Candidatus Dormibacteraeota bacterium]|jgi:biotin carboxyl carrier protein|nr:biotin/lipoyl-containing protein [Candidatus Dormibacteraeota bacterium]
MKYEVHIDGKKRVVELSRESEQWRVSLDGMTLDADAVEVTPNTFSILLEGESHEVRIAPMPDGSLTLHTGIAEYVAEVEDPRAWRGRRHGAMEVEGRQQITAPMPGKIVRILAKPGESVEIGQGLLVVEAMKMQNEIRSPKSGRVEKLFVKEGQAVNAGEVLAWVD